MSRTDTATPQDAALVEELSRGSLFRQARVLFSAIARTPGRNQLYALGVGIVVVILATSAAQVWLNAWNKPFYDAIERKDMAGFLDQLLHFFMIAGTLLALNVAQNWLNLMSKLKLREFATRDLIGEWLTDKRASRITRAGEIGVNPDQRIHEDTRHLTELTADLGIGLLQASLLLVSFVGVLWILSQGIVLSAFGHSFQIPGYMVWAALLYAATGSWLSWRIGRPLVGLVANRYAREADLRFSLVRANDQADGIALYGGEASERARLIVDLGAVLAMMRRIVTATVRLTWVTAGYGWVALVVPIIVAAPGYFSGSLTFGALMMVVGAFYQVQQALRWFVDNTGVIADWRATLMRVMNFREALLDLDRVAGDERIERSADPDGRLVLDDLALISFRGRGELSEKRLEVARGERVLVFGQPGSGKSTLFLALAGLWSWGHGRILMPPAEETMFLSHRPFLPPGPLRQALTYSMAPDAHDDAALTQALERTGLSQLSHALDRTERWDRELTPEEQQRLTFARMLLIKPKWVVSDEAFDSLDTDNRRTLVSIFEHELKDTAVLSIGSEPTANGFYSRHIELRRAAPVAPAKPQRPAKSRRSRKPRAASG